MKKIFLICCLFIIGIIGTGCVEADNGQSAATNANGDDVITLKVSTGLSPQNGWWVGFFTPWMERVEKETDGRVKFEAYTAAELLPIGEELQALRDGTIDIAAPIWTVYDPQRFPLSEVTMLPLTQSDPMIAAKAFAELISSDKELKDGKTFVEYEYSDKGIKVLPIPTTEQYVISTKDQKVETAQDLKKLTLRSPSRVHEMFAKKVGINTVSMPSSELFDAVNRGAVSGSFFSVADWTGYGMQDVFNYTLEGINLGHFSSIWAMSEEKWNSLPDDVKKIMENAAYDLIDDGAQEWMNRSEENRKDVTEKGAVFETVDDIDPKAKELLVKGTEETWMTWIEELENNGHPGKEIAKLWRDLLIEQGGDVPQAIKDLK
ncbi:MAG TPA: TRAP transporter substrate-binding protein DctP [Chondromyces sp.]|nr:TRAP transporter substrate-binding protein DctP [Chondromyces sp.]